MPQSYRIRSVAGVPGLDKRKGRQDSGGPADARLVLTDFGGIQEETTVLGVPCLTLRKNTERPVTIWEGTNRLVDPENEGEIRLAVEDVLVFPVREEAKRPELWDGGASDRIVADVAEWLTRTEIAGAESRLRLA